MRVIDERLSLVLREDEQRFDKKTTPFLNDSLQLYELWQKQIERLYPELSPVIFALTASEQTISNLHDYSASDLYRISHAVSTLFQLYNLAEEHHRLRRIGAHRSSKPEKGTFAALAPQESLLEELQKVNVRIVFTAHPTEVRRPALLREWRQIAQLLADSERNDFTNEQHQLLRDNLAASIQSLLVTGDVRTNEVTPYHEIRDLWSQLSNVWQASEALFHRIRLAVPSSLATEAPLSPLSFGCWVGSDADGNPNITAETMQYAADTLRRMALSRYLTSCETIRSQLTINAGLLDIAPAIGEWLSLTEHRMPKTTSRIGQRYREEPFRRAFTFICERISDTLKQLPEDESLHGYEIVRTIPPREIELPYTTASELENDLIAIRNSLHATLQSHYLPIEQLLFQVRNFGFHYASLEHRIHAKDVIECFQLLWQPENASLSVEQILFRIRETVNRCEAISVEAIAEHRVIKRLRKAAGLRRAYGSKTLDTVILSGTSQVEELLGLSLLLDACQVDANEPEPIRVVPLFETLPDLQHAPVFLNELFSLPYWQTKLQVAHRIQEVMLGYSDSGKDAGIVAANLALDQAAREIHAAGERNQVAIQFFHGRGGTVARGGGFLYQSIVASLHGVGDGHWKLTEQGEMIATRYGDPALAVRVIEQMLVATIEARTLQSTISSNAALEFEELSVLSEKAWRALVYEKPDFAQFFAIASPVGELSALRIGSRPAKRTPGGDISMLRAIPWNFAWLQNRINLTGWYGAGTALNAIRHQPELWHGFLAALPHTPILQLLIQKLRISLWLSDWNAAEFYLHRVPEEHRAYITRIRNEFDDLKTVLEELQEHLPAKSYAIFHASRAVRVAPLRGLAAIQSELIDRFRNQTNTTVETMLQRALLQSFIGVSAGLRNTG
ncbi:MAG: phosphoenolpyruvate carboxylase [bacterium]|nr:phosphoenolpyruvate carboxylase [bacterium]